MQKIIASFLVVLTLAFGLGASLVNAQAPEIPEKDGVYNDPDHPGIKVRVFVHNPRVNSPVLVCSDDDSTSVVGPAGWRLPLGQWNYKLNLSSVPSGSINLSTISSDAFSRWSNAALGKITFSKAGDTSLNRKGLDGQNIIAWGRTQGTALAVTYAWYNTSTHEAVETDTIMNNKFKWGWSGGVGVCPADPNVYDAQDILTHELGHWMGLDDEYTNAFVNNTMYGYGSKGEVKKDTLTSGDKAGVNAIYQ